MAIAELFSLQAQLFLMILVGLWLKKKGIVDESGKKCLTDLCVNVVIPCNILKSFLIEFSWDIFTACSLILLISAATQVAFVFLNRVLFNRYPPEQKKVLQYCVICSNGGFLGNPVCEGIYGALGLLYASFYLIPMRIVIWSTGLSYFTNTGSTSRKETIKKAITHPCLVSVYLGTLLMFTQAPLPAFLTETIRSIGNCNSALTMFIIGTILADVDLRTSVNKDTLWFSLLRLVLLPGVVFIACRLIGLDNVATGVSVLLTGMPAGSTSAIFAARYHSDAPFATKCVVFTTLLSLVTLPIWCILCG